MYVLFSDGLVVFTEYGDAFGILFYYYPVNEDRITCHLLELISIGRGNYVQGFRNNYPSTIVTRL